MCPLASDHHGLLIIPRHWLASSLCLLSTSKLVCGERSGAIWLPSHHSGGCCTLVVDEEIPPLYVKRFECLEKRYINVTNYYYYYYMCLCASAIFYLIASVYFFIIFILLSWLYPALIQVVVVFPPLKYTTNCSKWNIILRIKKIKIIIVKFNYTIYSEWWTICLFYTLLLCILFLSA